MSQVKKTILTGWSKSNGPAPYYNFQQDLTIVKGVILKGKRTVVPMSMRKGMLERIREFHLGPGKCTRKAREVLHWPNTGKDINVLINICTAYLMYHKKQQKEPLPQQAKPKDPWHTVGADLFT